MRKLFLILVVLVMCAIANADEVSTGMIYTMVITNSDGNAYQATAVPVTTIYPGRDYILGWSILKNDNTKNAELVASFYDQTSTAITNASGECLGEAETSNDPVNNTIWLPYPRNVENGVLVWQGPNTAVMIYWKRG
jgi:hypothetical protein